jgi:uncharacterized protein YgbK (DUF1537 family)
VSAIGVLADDLTGALGSAARLRAGGLEPVVVWRPEDLPREFRPRAAVVDMRTRDSPAGPRRTAATWAERLRKMDCSRFEQRIDSTLRGSPADELAGLLEGAQLTDAGVIAVPAWPDAGRTCRDGIQRGARREIDVAAALFDGAADVTTPHDLHERVAAGATRIVVDGENEADLRAAAVAVDALERQGHTIVTASPGAWLRHHPVSARPGKGFALVVLGSNTELNHRQLEQLDALVVGLEKPDWDEVATGGKTVVVETISDSEPDDVRRDPRLADHAADAAAAVLAEAQERGLKCRGVVASGGHMASRLVDALGAQRLAVAGEVAPLCARGTLAGGAWSGLPVITKGGLVGSEGTLRTLVDDLWRD